MRFVYIWGIMLAVIAGALGLSLASLRQFAIPQVSPVHEAVKMMAEAEQLIDSSLALRDAGQSGRADELEARAGELSTQAELVRGSRPMPALQMSEQFTARARTLADSAYRLRNAILTLNDSLTRGQERRIARIDWTARNLKTLARRLGSWGLNSSEQVELYNSCIMTYGEGARICEQMRSEVPPGH